MKNNKLTKFFGCISEEAADALEKSIEESRKIHRILHEKRIERLRKEFAQI